MHLEKSDSIDGSTSCPEYFESQDRHSHRSQQLDTLKEKSTDANETYNWQGLEKLIQFHCGSSVLLGSSGKFFCSLSGKGAAVSSICLAMRSILVVPIARAKAIPVNMLPLSFNIKGMHGDPYGHPDIYSRLPMKSQIHMINQLDKICLRSTSEHLVSHDLTKIGGPNGGLRI